jgi:DNA repair exonuclease SbcCD nuclease subunit
MSGPEPMRSADQPGGKAIKLLHTSDLHIGQYGPGDRAGLSDLAAILRFSRAARCACVVIAGDLFDHARIPPQVVAAAAKLMREARLPVVVLPGNHDPIAATSIWDLPCWNSGTRISVIRAADGEVVAPCAGLQVWGRPTSRHDPQTRPLARLPPREGRAVFIGIAHGHYTQPSAGRRSSPILRGDVEHHPFDYLALGHWDSCYQVTERCWYSGSPANPDGALSALLVLARAHATPNVNLVQIDSHLKSSTGSKKGSNPNARVIRDHSGGEV